MSEAPSAAGRRAAASYLRELLQRPGGYRRQWEQHVVRARPGEITQLAVAEVLARYLWSYPRVPGDADALPHQLKDTVSRALSGRLLSRSALALFIDAFGLTDHEADRLWRLWEGSGTISVLSGPRAMTSRTEQEVHAALGPRRHQTLSLHDHVYVGSDGLPARTRTLQVVEAIADGLDRIPYLYDTNALTLEVGQGCTDLSGELYQVSEQVFATHITLARALDAGETTTLEYWTTYQYRGDPLDPGEREYRRAVMGRLENFDMRVEFHPDKLPSGVWWASWDGVKGEILDREPVGLDSQYSVHRYLRFIEKTVAGFYWSW
ncbi:MAG TPA: hypothetical protein VH307_06630 [Streptosporangiaceae bacterium]|nr:hypothetical protein [Streptosporangiaceae bacterium]